LKDFVLLDSLSPLLKGSQLAPKLLNLVLRGIFLPRRSFQDFQHALEIREHTFQGLDDLSHFGDCRCDRRMLR
jgi:hypothetical protein